MKQIQHKQKQTQMEKQEQKVERKQQLKRVEIRNTPRIPTMDQGAEFLDKLTTLKELEADIVQGAEGNNNWTQGGTYNRAKEAIRERKSGGSPSLWHIEYVTTFLLRLVPQHAGCSNGGP
eukprot:10490528-Ditylum_brightwellii.AAC.1